MPSWQLNLISIAKTELKNISFKSALRHFLYNVLYILWKSKYEYKLVSSYVTICSCCEGLCLMEDTGLALSNRNSHGIMCSH